MTNRELGRTQAKILRDLTMGLGERAKEVVSTWLR